MSRKLTRSSRCRGPILPVERVRVVALATMVSWLASGDMGEAQTISCAVPSTCQLVLAAGASATIAIEFRDYSGALTANQAVTFSATAGSLDVPGATGPNGRAEVTWRGTVPLSHPVTITAWATAPTGPAANASRSTVVSRFTLRRAGAAPLGWRIASGTVGGGQTWFRGLALRDSLAVTIDGPTTRAECSSARVAFVPEGGAQASPDTVWGSWNSSTMVCDASSTWKLADFVGEQRLQARLLGTTSRSDFRAVSRQAARLAFAIAASLAGRDYDVLNVRTDTVVTQTTTVTDSLLTATTNRTITSDSTIQRPSRRFEASPAFGVDFPIRPKWRKVRLFAGVSLERPDREFFLAFSPLQAFWYGDAMEATGIDLFVGFQATRITRGLTQGCSGTARFCTESNLVIDGPTLFLVADGSKLLTSLASAFQ